MTTYYFIKPASNSFDEYEAIRGEELFDDDLSNVLIGAYLLGSDELPDHIDDIRGKIHNQDQVEDIYAKESDDDDSGIIYFGISEN